MLHAFALAFQQLPERRLLAVFAQSLAVTLAILVAIGVALHVALTGLFDPTGGAVATTLAVVIDAALLWLSFTAVAIGVVSGFGDRVVRAVEARHYPAALAGARPLGLSRGLVMGLTSAARLIGYNLLALPLYLVAAVTGVGLPIALLGVNGWLIGRDLGDLVAARHLRRAELSAWRRRTRGARLALGLAVGGMFMVPFVNLVAPVVGAAAMTHLFHRGRAMRTTRT